MDEIFTPPHFEVEEPNEAQGLVGRIEKNVDQLDPGHPARAQLLDLSAELREREDIMDEARETIEKLEVVVAKVTALENRIGIFLTVFPRFENGRPAMLSQIVVGGQGEAIEGPLLHPDLYGKFHHATPKGFLLYGPPGCGKTLISKATAWNLTQ